MAGQPADAMEAADQLLAELDRGDTTALNSLFAAYESYLRAVVRSQLSSQLRAKFDSVDVVQSVWVQLLRRIGRDGCRVTDHNHLRALLVTIARRRLVSRARQCRWFAQADLPPDDDPHAEVPDARLPSPSDAAQANDLWAKMLSMLPPDHHPILCLKREGLPLQEIARRTGLHEGSVRRILRRLARDLATDGGDLPSGLSETGPDHAPEGSI